MFLRFSSLIAICVLQMSAVVPKTQAADFDSDFAMEVVDLIHRSHIDAPTKQEMVLRGLKALRPSDFAANAELARQLSEMGGTEEIHDLVSSKLKEWAGEGQLPESAKRAFIRGVFQAVPGGGEFFQAKEARINNQLQANQYVGVGIALSMQDGLPLITKCFFHGPGYKAGVRDQDFILEIAGSSTKGKSLQVVVEELRGARGTDVDLVLKNGDQQPRKLTITREVTFIPTVEGTGEISPGQWSYILQSQRKIAYLKVVRIGPSTVRELKEINAQLLDHDIEGLILDVRGGGGTLHDTLMLADQFLDEGRVGEIVTLDGSDGHKSRAGTLFADVPMALLVDGRSGAGNAYLAAAMKDRGRAKIVGTRPQGPLLVKSQLALNDGSQIVFATGLLRRINGKYLSRVPAMQPEAIRVLGGEEQPFGLQPDVEVAEMKAFQTYTLDADPYVVTAVHTLLGDGKVQ